MNLLNMSFSAAILILAIVIIRALLLHKVPKKTFLILWGMALCRLLIPFEVTSRFSIYSIVNVLKGSASGGDFSLPEIPVLLDNTVIPSNTAIAEAALTATLPGAAYINISPLIIIWLIGLVVCAVFFLVTHLRCRREYKTALPIDNAFVRGWQQEHQLWRTVQIRKSDRISAPLTYGIFRPVILLPKQTDWADKNRLRYILTHEFVHIRRCDILTKLVMAAALCVHWFNPFVWVMYVLANRDIEMSCDETVVRTFGGMIKSAYALTLIELEEQKSHLTPLVSNFSKHAIEERVVSIMKAKKTSSAGIILAFILVVGTTTVFATNAASAAGENTNNEQVSSFRANAIKLGNTITEDIGALPDFQIEQAINCVPDYVRSFSNGFYFKDTVITSTEILDSNSNKVTGYDKNAMFFYTDTKDAQYYNGKTIVLEAGLEASRLPEEAVANTEERLYGDKRLTYSKISNKYVSEDYISTKEEEQQVAQGLLWISVNTEKAGTSDTHWVEWTKDGIYYSLRDTGCGVGKDKLFEMAEEVIDLRQ